MSAWSRYIARLLHRANAHPTDKRLFYGLKDELLMTRGQADGSDLQHITKECWRCDGNGCPRCFDSGLYQDRYVLLQRLRWEGYTFHRPIGDIPPAAAQMRRVNIEGFVEHHDVDARDSRVAELILYLIFRPRHFLPALGTGGWFLTPGPRPLLWVQGAIYHVRWFIVPRLRPVRCYQCSRRLWRFGRNARTWIRCRRCEAVMHEDEVPF